MKGSSLYVGSVMHRRLSPRSHRFSYRAFWLLIDLKELDSIGRRPWLFSHNRFNFFSLFEADHGDGSDTPLLTQVMRHLTAAGIDLGDGAIRLFCMPRILGYCFNPLSIYFCHRSDGSLAAILYEVSNTFGERHSYLIPVVSRSHTIHQRCEKQFYVSPFMDMEMRYDFSVQAPSERVAVTIHVSQLERPVMTARLSAVRKDIEDRALLQAFLAVPALTLKVTLAIRWEALRLWLKGLRLRNRPTPPTRLVSTIVTAVDRTD